MTSIALLYATTEGQTAKIAQHIASRGAEVGVNVHVRNLADLEPGFDLAAYDGAMLAGSIHEGHYQRALVHFVEQHAKALPQKPSALLTVCLAIHSPNADERTEAEHFPDQLTKRTGWKPAHSVVVAGALKYTQYSWLKRALMKQIAKKEGGATDTTQDHEYTDWNQVERFADTFFAAARQGSARAAQ